MASRSVVARLHRWCGLATALFLCMAGMTGSLLAFRSELEELLAPEVFLVQGQGTPLPLHQLAERIQAREQLRITYFEPSLKPQRATLAGVAGEPGQTHKPDFNEIILDPYSGRILGKRQFGSLGLDSLHLFPTIYALHSALLSPGRIGHQIMGVVALVWLCNCVFGFLLSLPRGPLRWKKWAPFWRVKAGASLPRLTLDLHRAGGLWIWPLFCVMAFTGAALNLTHEVFRPLVAQFGALNKPPLDTIPELPAPIPKPGLDWDQAASAARQMLPADSRDWQLRFISYLPERCAFRVRLVEPGFRSRPFHLKEEQRYVDALSGKEIARTGFVTGTTADRFVELQYPVHTGQAFGMPGRAIVSAIGILLAALSSLGVAVWWQRRGAGTRRPG